MSYSDVVVKNLFEKLGMTYVDAAVHWHSSPAYGTADSHIVEFAQPDEFVVAGVKDQVKKSTLYGFIERDARTLQHADICKIREAGLLEVYEDFRRDCERDLGIQTSSLREMEGEDHLETRRGLGGDADAHV